MLQGSLSDEAIIPIQVLELVKAMGCYPNVDIAYRILLTTHLTVASAERCYSKLKLLKTYLRSSMSQERLNGLAILCIEKEVLENKNFELVINDFHQLKLEKNVLCDCLFVFKELILLFLIVSGHEKRVYAILVEELITVKAIE